MDKIKEQACNEVDYTYKLSAKMRYAKYLGSERSSVNITFFVLDFIYSLFFFFFEES